MTNEHTDPGATLTMEALENSPIVRAAMAYGSGPRHSGSTAPADTSQMMKTAEEFAAKRYQQTNR